MSHPAATRLEWGIKRSFVDYVSGLDDGEIVALTPATVDDTALFIFPAAGEHRLDPQTGFGVLRFAGTATVSGHFGMMSVSIADPWIEIDREGATLTIPDPDRDPASGKRIAIVSLTARENGEAVYTNMPAALTVEAIGVFNQQYSSGSAMDPVTVVFAEP